LPIEDRLLILQLQEKESPLSITNRGDSPKEDW
jgi:hypothetical protein